MTSKQHKDLITNPDFIAWRLTGDPALEIFWEEYVAAHPEEKEAFEKAIHEFRKIKLNKESLSAIEEKQLLNRIHTSAGKTKKGKQIFHWSRYIAAASILFVAGISLYLFYQPKEDQSSFLSDNMIVWENLDEKDISLITDEETTTFSSDIRVHLDENGSAVVEEIGSQTSKVVGTGKTKMNKLIVPHGKRSQLTLADGTQVWINSGSVLEFPSAFTDKTRKISLIGEMYLEVTKDTEKPFFVQTKEMQIQVHGTKFNVSTYQEEAIPSVVLVKGSVSVKSPSVTDEIRLTPNDMLTLVHNRFEKRQVDVSRYTSWKDGYLLLNRTPMNEVIHLIERYYNLSFQTSRINNLGELTCTGKIYLSEDVNNVMETISLLSNTKYKRENKTIYLDKP
ncbi:MAG: FecR domain-containing protein [Tannerella sp.]|jgi:ferric-dicitrate binding protein FerR (iron transport regulator)|nr:FecR domain-containing protein [Tannerella sp.]